MGVKNFRIVENPLPHYYEKYDDFVELYNNPNITIVDIRNKLGWTVKTYTLAREKALSEGLIKERRVRSKKGRPRKKKKVPKNYYYRKNTGNYVVTKRITINKEVKTIYYGTYKNEEECVKIINELKKVNWDKKELPNIKKKLGISNVKKRYHNHYKRYEY